MASVGRTRLVQQAVLASFPDDVGSHAHLFQLRVSLLLQLASRHGPALRSCSLRGHAPRLWFPSHRPPLAPSESESAPHLAPFRKLHQLWDALLPSFTHSLHQTVLNQHQLLIKTPKITFIYENLGLVDQACSQLGCTNHFCRVARHHFIPGNRSFGHVWWQNLPHLILSQFPLSARESHLSCPASAIVRSLLNQSRRRGLRQEREAHPPTVYKKIIPTLLVC